MLNSERTKEKIVNTTLAYGLTVARLFIAYNMAQRVRECQNIALPMAAFVGADIVDGIIARKLAADTPGRRFADAAIDRLSVAMVAQQMTKAYPDTKKFLFGIGTREALVFGANFIHYQKTREVVQGTGVHKLSTLSLAGFGVIASYGNENVTRFAGSVANLINAGTAVNYVQNVINPQGTVENGIRQISFGSTSSSEPMSS